MSKSGLWAIVGIAVFTLLGLVYLALTWEAPQGTTTVVLPTPTETAPPAQPTSSSSGSSTSSNNNTQTLPQIRIQPQQPAPAIAEQEAEVAPPPVEVEAEQPEVVAETENEVELPSLNNSDSFVLDNLRMLENGAALVQRLNPQQLIRSFVVLVENVSRDTFPQTGLPYQSMTEEMAVRNIDENLFVMDDSAHRRFDAVIDTFAAVDTDAAMAVYRLLSPLFQQAYSEIGYRDQNFDDTLKQAIDNVLAMELPEGPYQLVKPSVMYLYADAEIENLSTVHKQLIRIGPENTARLKNKLRQFQSRL
jgi:hypothetical protein